MFSLPLSFLRSYLTGVLSDFVKKESFESLSGSLWYGTLILENAQLKESILDALGLPIALREGRVGRLEVTVPWTSIQSSSIVVRLENLTLIGDARYDFAAEVSRAAAARALALAEAQKKREELAKIVQDPVDVDKPANDPGFVERILHNIVENLQVVVAGLHIRIEDRKTCPGHPFAYGFTAQSCTFQVMGAGRGHCSARAAARSLQLFRISVPCVPPRR